MENRNKIIIGTVLTLGLLLFIKKYRDSKKTVKPTTNNNNNNVGNAASTPTIKGDEQPLGNGTLVLSNGELITTGGIRPTKNEEVVIKDPIKQEPILVTPPAPLPIDIGDGDEGIFVQEPFFGDNLFGDNLFGGIPAPILTNPIIHNPEPITVQPSPLPFDFGNGNNYIPEPIFVTPPSPLPIDFGDGSGAYTPNPIINTGFGSGGDSWNAFNNTTYSNTTLLGGGENNVRGF